MGAVCAIVGDLREDELRERLHRMVDRSPYRGTPSEIVGRGFAVAVQSLGWDASLCHVGDWVVAVHGYVTGWDDVADGMGRTFPSGRSPAEKIAEAYGSLGADLFGLLSGEFSIVMVNCSSGEAMAIRDVVGCRPLFVNRQECFVTVGTEIRQVLAGSRIPSVLNEKALVRTLGMVQDNGTETIYTNIARLTPGSISKIEPIQIITQPYWRPPETDRPRRCARNYSEELYSIVDQVVSDSKASHRFGVALSGGLDSGALWAFLINQLSAQGDEAPPPIAISLVYPGLSCDESELVSSLHEELGTSGTIFDASGFRPSDYSEKASTCVDSPYHPMALQMFIMSSLARREGSGVLFLGLGGDEFLRGSPNSMVDDVLRGRWFRVLKVLRSVPGSLGIRWWLLKSVLRRALLECIGARRTPVPPAWLSRDHHDHFKEASGSLHESLSTAPPSRRTILRELGIHRSGFILESLEQIAACNGVELRFPLLHRELIDFSFRTPSSLMIGALGDKNLLRVAMSKIVPGHVLRYRHKPLFDEILVRDCDENLSKADVTGWFLVNQGVFDRDGLDEFLDEAQTELLEKRKFVFFRLNDAQITRCLGREDVRE